MEFDICRLRFLKSAFGHRSAESAAPKGRKRIAGQAKRSARSGKQIEQALKGRQKDIGSTLSPLQGSISTVGVDRGLLPLCGLAPGYSLSHLRGERPDIAESTELDVTD